MMSNTPNRSTSSRFFNALGETIAVTAVPEADLEPLREDEVLCARVLAAA